MSTILKVKLHTFLPSSPIQATFTRGHVDKGLFAAEIVSDEINSLLAENLARQAADSFGMAFISKHTKYRFMRYAGTDVVNNEMSWWEWCDVRDDGAVPVTAFSLDGYIEE